MVGLRLEAEDAGIKNLIFEELWKSFGGNVGYYLGTQNAKCEDFRGLVSDIGKVHNNPDLDNDVIKDRIFTQLQSTYQHYAITPGTRSTIQEYVEIFFEGNIDPDIPHNGRISQITKNFVSGLMKLTLEKDDKTLLKTRVAAARLLNNLINPETKKYYELLKKKNPAVAKSINQLNEKMDSLAAKFFPTQKNRYIDLQALAKAVRDGDVKEGEMIEIKTAYNTVKMKFTHFNNRFAGNFIWGVVDGETVQLARADIIKINVIKE